MNKGRKGKGVPSLGNIPSGLPVIVTGASGSIGREICRALARLGVPVIMACRSEARYAQTYGELLREFPAFDAVFLPLDLNMSSSVTEAVNRLKGVRLAGIINNAGTMERHFSLSADGPETTMNVNYHNTRLLNQLLLPQIAPGGSVVFTTSLTRRRWGYTTPSGYCYRGIVRAVAVIFAFQGMDNPFRSRVRIRRKEMRSPCELCRSRSG